MNHLIATGVVLAFALMTATSVLALDFDGNRASIGNGRTGGSVMPGHVPALMASLSAGEEKMQQRCATILRSPAFDPELLPLCKLVARL